MNLRVTLSQKKTGILKTVFWIEVKIESVTKLEFWQKMIPLDTMILIAKKTDRS
jgi:hypothetical protein